MRLSVRAALAVTLFSVPPASAAEEFGIEEAFDKPTGVPVAVASDIEKGMPPVARQCFADAGTTAHEALEAIKIVIGAAAPAFLIKPKQPSEPKAAWGCFCGAYTCPMWLYSIDDGTARRLWESGGVSLTILDRKSLGYRRLLLSSGSAGHQEAALYGWSGHEYKLLREKSVVFGQGDKEDARAEEEMTRFLKDAAR